MLTATTLRKASSLAWWELKNNYKFCAAEKQGGLTTISLFGDKYKFFFDNNLKAAWVKSNHHYKDSSNFRLCTAHKNWDGMFSCPRQIVVDRMNKHISEMKEEAQNGAEHRLIGIEAKKVISSLYHADKKKMSRIFGGFLWKHMDRDLACLCMKVFGLTSGSFEYTLVSHNKEEVLDTLNKAPGILPIWRDFVLCDMDNKNKKHKLIQEKEQTDEEEKTYNCEMFQPMDSLDCDSARAIVDRINYVDHIEYFDSPNIIKGVKEKLMSFGLTNKGWRYLIKLSPRYSYRFLLGRRIKQDFVPLINWFAEIDVVPRYTLIKPILRQTQHLHRSPSLTSLMRSGLKHAQKIKGVQSFYDNQFQLVLDWFLRSAEGVGNRILPEELDEDFHDGEERIFENSVKLDHNQLKANWSWFMRQQEDWHRTVAEKQKAKLAQQFWTSRIQAVKIKGYDVVPLNSAYDLIDEGKDMHHCVGSYVNSCVNGRSRIFSIRKNNVKKATLEINTFSNKWEVNQIRGACNAEVSDELKKIAQQVVKLYNKKEEENGIKKDQVSGNV